MKNKHAYLIIAHKLTYVLETLIHLIDDSRNDIYIHVDKKCRNFDFDYLKTKNAKLYYTSRINVYWGGDTIIHAELILLNESTRKRRYAYYHLMSDSCLPIKSQDYIHDFFKINNYIQYVGFFNTSERQNYQVRYKYYYPFQNNIFNKTRIYKLSLKIFIAIQKMLNINRNEDVKGWKGDQWFSITDDFARYIIMNEKWINKTFKHSYLCDEIFIQTILLNSKDNKYKFSDNGCLRYIDWERGAPYIFKSQDYDAIMNSPCIFARKFNEEKDTEIINKIKYKLQQYIL